ncbi:hypothetical protein [Ancylobacter sp.]|uniref:hypothetical protein n=1 Tax=Ancylobacter sp. TaxID=1872567 RepID=UPI003D151500
MAEFWVFENRTHNYARIHRRTCCMCNDGRGMHTSSSGSNGHWHPTSSREEALRLAQQLGQLTINECDTCGGEAPDAALQCVT